MLTLSQLTASEPHLILHSHLAVPVYVSERYNFTFPADMKMLVTITETAIKSGPSMTERAQFKNR